MALVRYSTSRLQALEQAKRLIGYYPHAKPPDPDGYANGLADVFEQYPFGVVEECCGLLYGIARTRDFPPTPKVVIDWCESRLGAYQAIVRRKIPPPEKHYSEAHCATMRERLKAFVHGVFDKSQRQAAE